MQRSVSIIDTVSYTLYQPSQGFSPESGSHCSTMRSGKYFWRDSVLNPLTGGFNKALCRVFILGNHNNFHAAIWQLHW